MINYDGKTILIALSTFLKGDYGQMYHYIRNKIKLSSSQIEEFGTHTKSQAVTILDRDFPCIFTRTPQSPIVLYYYGNIDLLNSDYIRLGVVGSRTPTSENAKTTEIILNELLENCPKEVVVVSGMAKGIDAIAHRAAMRNNKPTIAILGSGIDFCYPKENMDIYEYCKSGKGLLLSEYPLNTIPISKNFPQRNRIIAGVVDALFVPQGAVKSGTSITLKHAVDLGKEVLCLPGRYEGDQLTNFAIKDGASLVNDVNDIVDALGIKRWKNDREISE